MLRSCPGARSLVDIRPEDIPCPHCLTLVEIWSDEYRARCPQCNAWVYRRQGTLCLDWCAKAQECVGVAAYAAYQRGRARADEECDVSNTTAL